MTDQEAAYIHALRVADIKVRLKNRKQPVDDTLVCWQGRLNNFTRRIDG